MLLYKDRTLGYPEINWVERQIFEQTPTSALSYEDVLDAFTLPKDLNGRRILDVGAGLSDFTAYLIENGADAYALDPLYASPEYLQRIVHRIIVSFYSTGGDGRSTYDSFLTWQESMTNNPLRYVGGFANKLPFIDNAFETSISCAAVSGYLDEHYWTYLQAVHEMLRVSRESVQLYPFDFDIENDPPSLRQERARNNAHLLVYLREQGYPFEIKQTRQAKTLIIKKKENSSTLSTE